MVTMSSRSRRSPIKVGFYDIQKTIGRGNFAEVKLARHRITKTDVAIKIIDKTSLDQTYLKKIFREIQILKLLNHQHIIKLYQVIQTKTTIYLVCEYARNGELFDYITQNGKLPEERAQKMFWQVLCAVEYCHKNNVVHRDLKAENMLLDGNNNIKLADFGFGNFFQSGQNLSTWCGSPPYAAPEVFEGKLYEGPQLDVWSLGVVLYVLVCGTFPFDGSNLSALKERVLGGLFRIPFWMSQDCENLLRRMLVLNPKKRLTISQIKKHKWLDNVRPKENLIYKMNERRGNTYEYNEHVFKIMQSLKIDINKTKESLNLSAYDHLYAIYHLLADRLKLHRTSYPLESPATGKRRPSNIAEQILLSVQKMPSNPNQSSSNPLLAGFNKTILSDNVKTNNNTMEIMSDISFDDATTELPTINRTLVDSPPLPLIKTTLCRDVDTTQNNQVYQQTTDLNLLHIPNRGSPVVHQSTVKQQQYTYNFPNSSGQTSNEGNDNDTGRYNLQQRRHTLMVPDSSQIQQFNFGLMNQIKNAQQLNISGDSINTQQELLLRDDNTYDVNQLHLMQQNRTHIYRNTNQLHPNDTVQYPSYNEQPNMELSHEPIKKVQNSGHNTNSSPIGFRDGRRASDGLLLLGDSLLKEHLQKLARVRGVPEITKDVESTTSHIPKVNNQAVLTNPSNPEAHLTAANQSVLYGSNGDSINFQPYNNNLSLSRRRSLQVQHMQLRRSSVTTVPVPTGLQAENTNHITATNCQDTFSGSHPGVNDSASNEAEYMRQWSSWKQVQGSHESQGQQFDDNEEPVNMFSSIAMSIASDNSVPSKAAVAAQIQRDALQKPVRQQSLPITPNPKGGYPFSSAFANQSQSLAQQLQQRRFERRIKVASHQHQQALAYQPPLPELERLRIDEDAFKLTPQTVSRIICNGSALNSNNLSDTEQCSQDNSVHGLQCFGSGEQTPIHFGLNMQMTVANSTIENNTGINEGDANFSGNLPTLNFGSNPDTVLSWVQNSHGITNNKFDSMEYAMY